GEPQVVGCRDAVRLFVHSSSERIDRVRVALLLKMDLPEIDAGADVSRIHLQHPLERGAGLIDAASRALDEAENVQRARIARQQARSLLGFPGSRLEVRRVEERETEIDAGQRQRRIRAQRLSE